MAESFRISPERNQVVGSLPCVAGGSSASFRTTVYQRVKQFRGTEDGIYSFPPLPVGALENCSF